jgi:hypothetical protein
MRRFQVCANKHVTVADGVPRIQGLLKAERGDSWKTVGVFSLAEDEWQVLAALCGHYGIAVVQDGELAQISS